jgi:large subunit ribosomal protein L21
VAPEGADVAAAEGAGDAPALAELPRPTTERTMYAVVETGGKQYRVEKGSTLLVDRLSADEGAKVDLRAVALMDKNLVTGKDAEKVKVEAKVAGHERGPKIRVFKYRPKKGYRRRAGHRSELTRIEVTEIKLLQRKPAAKKPAARKPAAKKETKSDGS